MVMEDEKSPPVGALSLLGSVPPSDPAILQAFSGRRLRTAHYAAIGEVAAMWAYFELAVDEWLAMFAKVEIPIGLCFTGQMIGPNPRLSAFIALVRHRGAKKKWNKVMEELALDVSALAEQRNRAVHDIWDLTEATAPQRIESTARRAVRMVTIHVPTENLQYLAEQIRVLQGRFEGIASQIFTEIFSSVGASPETIPPIQGQ